MDDRVDERAGSSNRTRAAALLCLLACLVLVGHGWLLALHFEATPRAIADAAEGKRVGYTAAAGAVAAVAALVGARRRWGLWALVLAVVLTAVAIVVDIT